MKGKVRVKSQRRSTKGKARQRDLYVYVVFGITPTPLTPMKWMSLTSKLLLLPTFQFRHNAWSCFNASFIMPTTLIQLDLFSPTSSSIWKLNFKENTLENSSTSTAAVKLNNERKKQHLVTERFSQGWPRSGATFILNLLQEAEEKIFLFLIIIVDFLCLLSAEMSRGQEGEKENVSRPESLLFKKKKKTFEIIYLMRIQSLINF